MAVTKLEHTFTPYVGSSHSYDSNLLRASDNPIAGQKSIRDSFIHQIRAGLNVDWRYSLQQIIIKGDVNYNWFTGVDGLDYLGHDVLGQWNWVAGSRLKGEVGYKHDEILGSFAQLGGTQDQVINNLQTDENYFANAEYQIIPDIYLKAGFFRNEWLFGGDERKDSNQIQNNGEFSLQYRNLTKTTIGFRALLTAGEFPDRGPREAALSDVGFFRSTYYLDWEWRRSDKLRLGGFAGYVEQEYDNLTALNFSEPIARVNVSWFPSEKSELGFSVWQQVDQAYTQNATFVLSQGVSGSGVWKPTTKIRVEMPLSFEVQEYLGDPPRNISGQNPGANLQKRSDDVINLGFNIIYLPWVNTELALKYEFEDRSSNELGSSYDASTVSIIGKVEF